MCLHTCTIFLKGMLHVHPTKYDIGSKHAAARMAPSSEGSEASKLHRQRTVPVYAVLQKLPLEHPSSYEEKGDSPVLACC